LFPPVQTTPPADPPVSVADVKGHLRIGHSSEDAVLEAFLAAAVSHLDGHSGILGRCMVTQTWKQPFPCWPVDGCLRLPFPDVDVDSVEIHYLDELADDQTLADDEFEVLQDDIGAYVRLRAAFTSPAIQDDRAAPVWVVFDAGYGDATKVPPTIKAAILLIVGDLYENRENTVVEDVRVTEMPIAASRLLAPFRRVGI
jgi:uncharacterized phiE125 gp8 family phage protein